MDVSHWPDLQHLPVLRQTQRPLSASCPAWPVSGDDLRFLYNTCILVSYIQTNGVARGRSSASSIAMDSKVSRKCHMVRLWKRGQVHVASRSHCTEECGDGQSCHAMFIAEKPLRVLDRGQCRHFPFCCLHRSRKLEAEHVRWTL